MKVQPTTEKAGVELTVREAALPPKLRDWRAKLSAKAKQEKRFRFYSLYGLLSHPVTLRAATAVKATAKGTYPFTVTGTGGSPALNRTAGATLVKK